MTRTKSLPLVSAVSVAILAAVTLGPNPVVAQSGQWPVSGQGLNDLRSQPAENLISPSNVGTLTPKWVFTTGGDVSATPTVAGNAVYVTLRDRITVESPVTAGHF